MSKIFSSYTRDPISDFLGTGYIRFKSRQGIDGLCTFSFSKNGYSVELLAVSASNPGTGQFRRFIEALKEYFDEIIVWEIQTPFLIPVLSRYGFVIHRGPSTKTGEMLEGMIWLKDDSVE